MCPLAVYVTYTPVWTSPPTKLLYHNILSVFGNCLARSASLLLVFHTCFYSSNQSVLHFCHFSLIYPQETVPQFMWKFLQTWYVLVFFFDSQPLLYPPINTIHIQCFTSFKVQIVFFDLFRMPTPTQSSSSSDFLHLYTVCLPPV